VALGPMLGRAPGFNSSDIELGANLRGADLAEARLDGAILEFANLPEANLRRAILTATNLSRRTSNAPFSIALY